jgi:hypothetical protein
MIALLVLVALGVANSTAFQRLARMRAAHGSRLAGGGTGPRAVHSLVEGRI